MRRTRAASASTLGLYRGGLGGKRNQDGNTPAGKAIRAVPVQISEYAARVMVDKDACRAGYRQKEQRRRKKIPGAIRLGEQAAGLRSRCRPPAAADFRSAAAGAPPGSLCSPGPAGATAAGQTPSYSSSTPSPSMRRVSVLFAPGAGLVSWS